MNTRVQILEIKKLIDRAQGLLEMVIASQPKQILGKPTQPYYTQRVATKLWEAWEKLKAKGKFDASEAKRIATGDTNLRHYRIDSSYSAVLSQWAKEGYLDIIEKGSGPRPSIYKIPN